MASSLKLAFGDKEAWKEVQGVHSILIGAPSLWRHLPALIPLTLHSTSTVHIPMATAEPAPDLFQPKTEPEEDLLGNFASVNSEHEDGIKGGETMRQVMNKHKESFKDQSTTMTKKLPAKKKMCDLCGYRSLQKQRWSLHDMRCPPKEWPCDKCGLTLKKESNLKKHIWDEHEKNRCGEGDCEYESPFQGQLTFHRLKEHGGTKQADYYCDMCTEVYANKSGLKRHISNKHEGKIINCGQCNLQVLTRTYLKSHIDLKHKDTQMLVQQ